MLRRVIIVLLLVVMATSICSAKTEIRCQSNVHQIEVGEIFSFDVVIKPDHKIDTVAIDLMSWDPNILEFVKVEQGNLFNNSLVWITGIANNGNYTGLCWGCDIPTDGEGILARFIFKGIANGTSSITLDKTGVAFAGEPLVFSTQNLIITVSNSAPSAFDVPIFFIVSIIVVVIAVVVILIIKKRGLKKEVESPRDPSHPDK